MTAKGITPVQATSDSGARRNDASPQFFDPMTPSNFEHLYGRQLRPQRGLPWTFANMVAGADGAATMHGRAEGLSSVLDQALFQYLRGQADVVLVGAQTVRAEGYGPIGCAVGARPRLAIVTSSGDFDYSSLLFAGSFDRPILVAPRSQARLIEERADGRAEVLVAGERRVDLAEAVDNLAQRQGPMILTEGGPTLLTGLMRAGVVNELCLTIAPKVGGEDIRIMDLAGDPLDLRIEHIGLAAGSIFLRYLVQNR